MERGSVSCEESKVLGGKHELLQERRHPDRQCRPLPSDPLARVAHLGDPLHALASKSVFSTKQPNGVNHKSQRTPKELCAGCGGEVEVQIVEVLPDELLRRRPRLQTAIET